MEGKIYTPLNLDDVDDSLQTEIRRHLGIDVALCLECGKCSGGCPNRRGSDFTPRKIVRLVKLGDRQTLMSMDALWSCLSCQLCLDRCPSGIDIPSILDYMREKACRSGARASRPLVRLFHELVLSSIKKRGRVSELELALKYNVKTGQYMKDVGLGLRMLFKGRLGFLSGRVKNREEIRRLFERSTSKGSPV